MRLTLRLLTCQRFSVKSRRRGRSRSHRPKQVQIRCALKTQKRAHNLLFRGKIILYVSKKKMCRTYTCKICISWVLQTSSFISLKLEKCAILISNFKYVSGRRCLQKSKTKAKINVIFITPSDHSFGLVPFEKMHETLILARETMCCLIQLHFSYSIFLVKTQNWFHEFFDFLHLYFSKQTLSDRCFEPQQQQELSNPHRILLLILRGGRRALETSHRRPSTRCAALDCGLLLQTPSSLRVQKLFLLSWTENGVP